MKITAWRIFKKKHKTTFDDTLVEILPTDRLASTWRRHPPPIALQRLGDQWLLGGKSAVLQVPSVIVPAEYNFLLNPNHPDYSGCIVSAERRRSVSR